LPGTEVEALACVSPGDEALVEVDEVDEGVAAEGEDLAAVAPAGEDVLLDAPPQAARATLMSSSATVTDATLPYLGLMRGMEPMPRS
jgi:hypothetical protein